MSGNYTLAESRVHIPEIDSLRALAVLAVVLFHAFPSAITGGFIGVDVFFVVSGFVIARSYLFDLLSGQRRLTEFYIARFRRLAPALGVVLFATTLGAILILQPDRLVAYGWSLIAQPIYLQNLVFWAEGDYFSGALTKPLLHTWSLAVEEQFYILWAGLILAIRRFPSALWPVLLGGVVLSLVLGAVVEPRSPKTVFYLLPTRIWEFALGIIAYLAVCGRGRPKWLLERAVKPLALILIGLLVLACFVFPEGATFPGPQSALACAATISLLALMHLFSGADSLASLRFAPFTYVGKVSYGFYLWHWPPLVLFFMATEAPPDPGTATLLMVGAFLGSVVSYHLFEEPIRRRRALRTTLEILSFVGISSAVVLGFGVLLVGSGGLISRYPEAVQPFLAAPGERGTFRCGKIYAMLHPAAQTCPLYSSSQESGNVLVLGDSHADVLKEMIANAAQSTGRGVHLAVRNCDLGRFGTYDFCSRDVLARLLAEAQALGVTHVVAISYWEPEKFDAESMGTDIAALLSQGMSLTILSRVPNDPSYDPRDRARAALAGAALDFSGIPLERYIATNRDIDAMIATAASRFPPDLVGILSPADLLCPEKYCLYHENGILLYIDTNHLSYTGANLLLPMFEDLFALLPR